MCHWSEAADWRGPASSAARQVEGEEGGAAGDRRVVSQIHGAGADIDDQRGGVDELRGYRLIPDDVPVETNALEVGWAAVPTEDVADHVVLADDGERGSADGMGRAGVPGPLDLARGRRRRRRWRRQRLGGAEKADEQA